MAVIRSHKLTDTEKRLQLLSRQLYGKGSPMLGTTQITRNSANQTYRKSDQSGTLKSSESFRTDVTYLKQDLTKILILASIAVGVQLVIYYFKFFERG